VRRSASSNDEASSDEALLAAMALGDDQAGLAFVRRYQHRLFGLAMGISGDVGLAEDVAQEAFIRIFGHAAVFDARRGSVASWALTIARNLAIDALRIRRATPTDPDDRVFLELMGTEAQPEEAALATDALSRVRAALAELPTEQRRALLLGAMYGRSSEEIAHSEDIPQGTAKSRIRLGMAKLRDLVVSEETR
jgi:RNA polymerase sigma-70 factor (ECF subfamily)